MKNVMQLKYDDIMFFSDITIMNNDVYKNRMYTSFSHWDNSKNSIDRLENFKENKIWDRHQ